MFSLLFFYRFLNTRFLIIMVIVSTWLQTRCPVPEEQLSGHFKCSQTSPVRFCGHAHARFPPALTHVKGGGQESGHSRVVYSASKPRAWSTKTLWSISLIMLPLGMNNNWELFNKLEMFLFTVIQWYLIKLCTEIKPNANNCLQLNSTHWQLLRLTFGVSIFVQIVVAVVEWRMKTYEIKLTFVNDCKNPGLCSEETVLLENIRSTQRRQ